MTSTMRSAVMFATLGVAAAGPALAAAERTCLPAPVQTDARVRARWPDLAERIGEALDGRSDIDDCARVAIRMPQTAILLEVVLPDGRATSRSVSRREDVIPTLEALLLLPIAEARGPDADPARAPAAAPPTGLVKPDGAPQVVPKDSSASRRPGPVDAEPAAAPFRLEFSLAAGARAGDGKTGVGVGAFTLFDIRGWLVGLQGEVDRYQRLNGATAPAALELALLAGRRFHFGRLALDLLAGPAAAVPGFAAGSPISVVAYSSTAEAAMSLPYVDGPQERLRCAAHLTFRARSLLRSFAGVEGDLPLRPQLAGSGSSLPVWSVGLVVGATVGTP